MTLIPTCPRMAPCSPPSSTLRAASGGGLRPCLTAAARVAWKASGRDEETARVSRTKKHAWQQARNDRGQFLLSSKGQIRMSLDNCRCTVTCAVLMEQFIKLDKQVHDLARHDPKARRLTTAPGVGSIVALTFAAAIDDPGRFKSSKTVGALFGLTPKRYQSGEADVSGRISKIGDESVRTALYEAANAILERPINGGQLKTWAKLAQGSAGEAGGMARRGVGRGQTSGQAQGQGGAGAQVGGGAAPDAGGWRRFRHGEGRSGIAEGEITGFGQRENGSPGAGSVAGTMDQVRPKNGRRRRKATALKLDWPADPYQTLLRWRLCADPGQNRDAGGRMKLKGKGYRVEKSLHRSPGLSKRGGVWQPPSRTLGAGCAGGDLRPPFLDRGCHTPPGKTVGRDKKTAILESDSNRMSNSCPVYFGETCPMRVHQAAARRRDISLTLAMKSQQTALSTLASTSLARRRFRFSQANVRSTTQRRGSRTNPLAVSDRLTISIVQSPRSATGPFSLSPA